MGKRKRKCVTKAISSRSPCPSNASSTSSPASTIFSSSASTSSREARSAPKRTIASASENDENIKTGRGENDERARGTKQPATSVLKESTEENKGDEGDDDSEGNTWALSCARCYTDCAAGSLTCDSCRKRTYCSLECRDVDRTSEGQYHELWCKAAGEERFNWEVRWISAEKEMGMVALRDFVRGDRILVEPTVGLLDVQSFLPAQKTALMALTPADGTVADKFANNSIGDQHVEGDAFLGMRTCRANHACAFNACAVTDEGRIILLAERGIRPGEEICISYVDRSTQPPAVVASMLKERWGITCPSTCLCHDELFQEFVQKDRLMDQEILDLGSNGQEAQALRVAKELLNLRLARPAAHIHIVRTAYDAFTLALSQSSTMHQASAFAELDLKLSTIMYGSASAKTGDALLNVDHPERHDSYLCMSS